MIFSIVTPVLDRCELIGAALASVAAQEDVDVEHIVVDGGSTDGTLEVLQAWPNVAVIDDRRRGLYDAINLGIERASGEVIGLLNSDDLYTAGALKAVESAFAAAPHADVVCGSAELFDMDGVIQRYNDPRDLKLDAHAALIGACIPNARFFRRRMFEHTGLFSLDYRYVSDRDFLARALLAGIETSAIKHLVYRYRRHERSLTLSKAETADAVRLELLRLSRSVAERSGANHELRWKARALEGRCLGRLAVNHIRVGNGYRALQVLTRREGILSSAPLLALAIGCLDKLISR